MNKIRGRCGNISFELAEGWQRLYLIQFQLTGEPLGMIGLTRRNCRRFSPAFGILRDALKTGRIRERELIAGCKKHGAGWRDGKLAFWIIYENGSKSRVELDVAACLADTEHRKAMLLELLEIITKNEEVA